MLLLKYLGHVIKLIYRIFVWQWLCGYCIYNSPNSLIQHSLSVSAGRLFLFLNVLYLRKVVFIPVGLIKKADNEYWLRSLAYYVRLKSLYKNNTHFNFTLRSLADRVKCSPACLSFHLKELNKYGLLRYHVNNLTFVGLRKLQEIYKPASVGVPVEAKNQYDILRGQIIRFNLSAQAYNIRKSGIQKQCGNVPFSKSEKINSCYVGLSAEGIGNLFGLSNGSGSRIRKKLNTLRIIRSVRVFSTIYSNTTLDHYLYLKYGGLIPIYSRYVEGDIIVERRMKMEYFGM